MSATEESTRPQSLQLACFLLAGDVYAVDIMRIKEIVPMQRVRPVPRAPRFVCGVINLRGAVLPVVDLRERFGMGESDAGVDRRIIITSVAGRLVGLIVDAVTEILKIEPGGLVRVPSLLKRRDTAYVHGIAMADGEMVLVLNLDRILTSEETINLDAVRQAALRSPEVAAELGVHDQAPEGGEPVLAGEALGQSMETPDAEAGSSK